MDHSQARAEGFLSHLLLIDTYWFLEENSAAGPNIAWLLVRVRSIGCTVRMIAWNDSIKSCELVEGME